MTRPLFSGAARKWSGASGTRGSRWEAGARLALFSVVTLPLLAVSAAPDVPAEARAYLGRLVALDTSGPAGPELPLMLEIARHLNERGIYAQVHPSAPGRGNLVARLAADSPRDPPLVLQAPLDVTQCTSRRFAASPLVLTEKDGQLTGCGVAASKGAAAAMIAVLVDLHVRKVPLRRDVLLLLTADSLGDGDAGLRHLLSVLPNLPRQAVVLTPGAWSDADDEGNARFIGVQHQARPSTVLTLDAKGDALGPAATSAESSSARLLRALGRVSQHRFPVDDPETATALAAIPGLAEAKIVKTGEGAPLFGPMESLVHTTCRVINVDLATRGAVNGSTASASVRCHPRSAEDESQLAWSMVDIIKDPRVVIGRNRAPAAGPSAAPRTDVMEAVKSAATEHFKAPVVWQHGPSTPEAALLRRGGWDVYEIGFFPLTRAQWSAAYADEERVHARVFHAGSLMLARVVDTLVALR